MAGNELPGSANNIWSFPLNHNLNSQLSYSLADHHRLMAMNQLGLGQSTQFPTHSNFMSTHSYGSTHDFNMLHMPNTTTNVIGEELGASQKWINMERVEAAGQNKRTGASLSELSYGQQQRAGGPMLVENKQGEENYHYHPVKKLKGSSEVNSGHPRFKDLGGMEGILKNVENTVIVPLVKSSMLLQKGIKLKTGILLHGPPGCGKTTLAHAIANELRVPFHHVCASELVAKYFGESEGRVRDLFSKAYNTAPSIVFIDEIDAIGSKRVEQPGKNSAEQRILIQLIGCIDECYRRSQKCGEKPGYILVIGATNMPDALDPALRRAGRFETEILLGVPDENGRADILSRKLPPQVFDVMKIARSTPGYVPADFDALVTQASSIALERAINKRMPKQPTNSIDDEEHRWWMEPWLDEAIYYLTITMDDIEEAIKLVQPSTKREGFSTVPDVKWEDVGGLNDIRQTFDRFIVSCVKYPEENKICGGDMETGFLLFGPPGCGKTLIAKAVANEAGANFIYVKGPELFNKWMGESERAVRTLFSRARTCSPCIIFFDEIDSLATKRNDSAWGQMAQKVVTQLLIELDGRDQRQGVFVIGATNRIDQIDEAILRPGRLCKRIFVPLPSPDDRGVILNALAKGRPIDPSVNLNDIGRMEACENFSGADLKFLMKEAIMAARDEAIANRNGLKASKWTVKVKHFEQVVTKISPSVSEVDRQRHWTLAKLFNACNL